MCWTSNWSHVPSRCLRRALDHVGLGAAADVGLADAREDLRQPRLVRRSEQLRELRAFHLVDAVAEHALDRRALVRHGAVRVEHGDQVARVRDERAEARLAPPAVEVLGQRRSLDGERDLGGERLERVDLLARESAIGRAEDEQAARLVTDRRAAGAARAAASMPKLGPHGLGQSPRAGPAESSGDVAEPAVGVSRQRATRTRRRTRPRRPRRRPSAGARRTRRRLADEQGRTAETAASLTCSPPAAATRSTPAPSQRELARRRSLLLAHEAGHARDDEKEQRCRGDDEHEHVGVAPRLPGADSGRDQTGAGEQSEAKRREARARLERRLFERPHRRVERGGAPEQVVRDPADVVDQLVVVRVGEQRVRVGRVDGEQARRCCRSGDRRPARAFPCRRRAGSRRREAGCLRADRRRIQPSRAA